MRSVMCVAVLVLELFGIPVVGMGQVVVDESFDAYPVGSPPGAPWWNWGTDGVTLVDDTQFNGLFGHSVVLSRTVFPGDSFAFGRHFPAQGGHVLFEYSFRITGNPREVLTAFAVDDGNAVGPWVTVGYPLPGVWVYSESLGWLGVPLVILPDTWNRVRLDVDVTANTYDVSVWREGDMATVHSVAAVPFRTAAGVGPLTNIQFGDFNISVIPDGHVAWVDDVLVLPLVFGDSFESGDTSGWSSSTS